MRSSFVLAGLLLLAFPGRAHAASADTVGTIVGHIVTPGGEPASFANIIVEGTRRGAQSDERGHFTVTLVPLGEQTLRVHLVGHEGVRRTVTIAPGDNPLGTITAGKPMRVKPMFVRPETARVAIAPGDLVAEIVMPRKTYKLNEHVELETRIYNRSDHPILLMPANCGPRTEMKIAAPFDAFELPPRTGLAFCGGVLPEAENWSQVFIELQPGEFLDPYFGQLPSEIRAGTATRPGKYTVTFRYSTVGPEFGVATRQGNTPELIALLGRVPKIELEAKADFKVDY